MKTAIMQPYLLPYLGYFQLIAAVDCFVIYDTIQYTKKGWINRNQMLRNGAATLFSIPLQKGSDFADVRDRSLADAYDPVKFCAQFAGAYRKAPEFVRIMPLVEKIAHHPSPNLFDFIHAALRLCCDHLCIETPIRVASQVEGGSHVLTGVDRVIDICHRVGATTYVNPPGGRALYDAGTFARQNLTLKFLQPRLPSYPQFGGDFVPSLSILDVMMFNNAETVRSKMLGTCDLVD